MVFNTTFAAMQHVYLLLGSNLGDRLGNLKQAANLIHRYCGPIQAVSSVYESMPWGYHSEHNFYNAALHIQSALAPIELLEQVKRIEAQIGRQKNEGLTYDDRLIDIDILLSGRLIVAYDKLQIPHPRLHLRLFALTPLKEINENLIHPLLNKNIACLFKECPDENTPMLIHHRDYLWII